VLSLRKERERQVETLFVSVLLSRRNDDTRARSLTERAADADSAVLNSCILILRCPQLRVNKGILIASVNQVATIVSNDSIVGMMRRHVIK